MDRTWDLSFMYDSFDDPNYAADVEKLNGMIADLETIIGADMPIREKLEKMTDAEEALSVLLDRLFSFCYLNMAVDAGNAVAARWYDKLCVIDNRLSLVSSAADRLLGGVQELDAVIASSEKLQPIAFALKERAEEASHLIPEAIEPWVLEMQLSGGSAFSQLRDKLDSTHLVPYRGKELPLSAVRGMAYDADPAVRKDAYEAEIAAYKAIELPMSFCLNSIKKEARTLAQVKGFGSVLDMTLNSSRMDKETLDAMWSAIREYLPHFRRYMRMKGHLLGHENGLPFYDMFAPLTQDGKSYTVEEAREILVREMGKFTPDMAAFIANAFDSRWIDMFPREGKTGGAFCSGIHGTGRSCVMTNFQGSFSDVSTLAHELGHAWHNRCMEGLPAAMKHEPMPLAETASIFNETMLSHQVMSSCSPDEELALLDATLMEATQTVVDIYSRFLFESEVVETRADHAMTVEELKNAMLRAQDASYGEGLDPEIRHPYMWACKSHYYSSGLNFYNFPYAFGLLFGTGVFARYLEKGAAFADDYCKLLRSCGSAPIADVALSVGIDVRSIDFWRSSLEVLKKKVDRFCELGEKR